MSGRRPAKLRVILNPDDTRKLLLPGGIPETMEQLLDEIKNVCGLKGNIRLQYQDKDFGDALVNLTSKELDDLATLKVILMNDCSQEVDLAVCDDSVNESIHSDDTVILSSPSSSVSTRTQMWPREFPIPTFSYNTELQLEKGNTVFRSNMTRLTLSSKTKSDILEKVSEEIFQYKAYPTDADFSDVAEALIKKHPCLSEPGSWQINSEFLRITTVPLQPRILASLDKHHAKLIEIFQNKGGVFREKTRDTLKVLDQSLDVNLKRECLLKCLIVYLDEDVDKLIKEYQIDQKDEAETDLQRCTMAVYVIRRGEDLLQQPYDIGIVIEGVEALNGLPSIAHACAMLFGLIYALNLSYPKELKLTFDALQKLFMEIEPKKMTRRVCSLSVRL